MSGDREVDVEGRPVQAVAVGEKLGAGQIGVARTLEALDEVGGTGDGGSP